MFNKSLVLIAACYLLSSCVTTLKQYEGPKTQNAATIKIITFADTRINMAVWHYPGEEYLDTNANYIGKLNSTALGDIKTNEFTIKATPGIEFRFAIQSALQEIDGLSTLKTVLCKPHVGFIPRNGITYVAEHKVYTDKCEINVYELENGRKIPDSTQKYYNWCLDSFFVSKRILPEKHCKPGFKYKD